MGPDFRFEGSFDAHRIAQIRRLARETTPEQRLLMVEEMLRFARDAGIDYLEAKHRHKENRKATS